MLILYYITSIEKVNLIKWIYNVLFRLLINEDMGGGADTSYTCGATMEENTIPTGDTVVNFRVDSKYSVIDSKSNIKY